MILDETDDTVHAADEAAADGPAVAGQGGNLILIVDDEVDIIKTYSMLFALENFEVIAAPNGYEALSLMRKRRPAIILSDCIMPVMDGLEFCSKVRRNPSTRGIPIVLMTGAPERHDFTGVDYDRLLRKPCAFVKLLAAVDTLLAIGEDERLAQRAAHLR